MEKTFTEYLNALRKISKTWSDLVVKHDSIVQTYNDMLTKVPLRVKEFETKFSDKYKSDKIDAKSTWDAQKEILNRLAKHANPNDAKILDSLLDAVKFHYSSKIENSDELFKINSERLKLFPGEVKSNVEREFVKSKDLLFEEIDKFSEQVNLLKNKFNSGKPNLIEYDNTLWNEYDPKANAYSTYLTIAECSLRKEFFNKEKVLNITFPVPFLNQTNIIIIFNSDTEHLVHEYANSLILRLVAALPKQVELNLVDTHNATRNLGALKKLPKEIQNIITDKNGCQSLIKKIKNNIVEFSIRLDKKITDIEKYNLTALSKQKYYINYFSDLIRDIDNNDVNSLEYILNNGPKAGVSSVLLLNKDLYESNIKSNSYGHFLIDNLNEFCVQINFTERKFTFADVDYSFNTFSDEQNDSLIREICSYFETEKSNPDTILFENYFPPEKEWWMRSNADGLKVPIGIYVEENNKIKDLDIFINSNDYCGIIVGLPGQGKSSLYHSLICNILWKYGPSEVELYLVDLKSVEFAAYAKENYFLPHVKAVVSNSDREFALSLIEEMVKEGMKRENLHKLKGVTHLKDYNLSVTNAERLPQKILIIDEFIQIFTKNDEISKKASAALEKILQVYRAFGINVFLACQSLDTSKSTDIYGIMGFFPMRFVFKCKEHDRTTLLKFEKSEDYTKKISGPGQFVFNNNNGTSSEGSAVIKSMFLSNKILNETLEKISKYTNRIYKKSKDTKVYDLSKFSRIDENKELSDISKIQESKAIEVFFGKSLNLNQGDIHFSFKKDSNSNGIIIGGEEAILAIRIISNIIASIMLNDKNKTFELYIFSGIDEESEYYNIFNSFVADLDYNITLVSNDDIENVIMDLHSDLEESIESKQMKNNARFLLFVDFHRIRFNRDTSDATILQLKEILKEGPLFSMYNFYHFDTINSFYRKFGEYTNFEDFNHRIALQMPEMDSRRFVSDDRPNGLVDPTKSYTTNYGYYYNINSNAVQKFIAYDFPNKTWLIDKLRFQNKIK